MANKLSVAFIGTGIMGAPIAGHILDAGYPVTVNNRTKSKAAALIERGAAWADTPADAAANADVVFTMVGYPSEVEELYLAGDGLLACTKPGAVLIDLTTSSPELARDIAEAAQVSGRMAFDCPVTGGESGAIAGTLTAIVALPRTTSRRSATSFPPLRQPSAASTVPARARLPSSPTRCRWAPAWSAWQTPWHLPS